MIFGKSYDAGRKVSYEQILVADELSESVQRAGGVPLQRRETPGEQVRIMVAQRGALGPRTSFRGSRLVTRLGQRTKGRVTVPDKLTAAPLAEIPVGREVREVRLLAKLLD